MRIPENKNAGPADEEMQQFKKDCEKLAGAGYNVQRANAGRLDGWELHFVQSPAVADEHFFLDRPLERIREIITACVGAPSPAWQHASFVDQRRIHVPVGNPDDAQLEHELSVLENAGWLVLDSDQESGWQIVAPLQEEIPHSVLDALVWAVGLPANKSWLDKGVERGEKIFFSSRDLREAEQRNMFVTSARLHSRGWKVLRTSSRSSGADTFTFEPPFGLVQPE